MTFSQLVAMDRAGSITVSMDAWIELMLSTHIIRRYLAEDTGDFIFHGPHGAIKVTYDPSLPAGEHIWTSDEAGYAEPPRGGFRECRVCGAPGQGDVCEYCRTRRESPKPKAHASVDAFNQWSRSSPLRSGRWPT